MKTKKLLKTLIKSQKYRIQQLRDNNQTQVNDLARKIQSVHADRETWILRCNTLESQNKALQSEKEQLKEQLGLADFTVAKLKTKLSKFEDLKKEAGVSTDIRMPDHLIFIKEVTQ